MKIKFFLSFGAEDGILGLLILVCHLLPHVWLSRPSNDPHGRGTEVVPLFVSSQCARKREALFLSFSVLYHCSRQQVG